MKSKFSESEVSKLLEKYPKLKVKFDEIGASLSELVSGVNEELEHKDTVHGDVETIIKIVFDHLKEDSGYYSKLDKIDLVEKGAEEVSYLAYRVKAGELSLHSALNRLHSPAERAKLMEMMRSKMLSGRSERYVRKSIISGIAEVLNKGPNPFKWLNQGIDWLSSSPASQRRPALTSVVSRLSPESDDVVPSATERRTEDGEIPAHPVKHDTAGKHDVSETGSIRYGREPDYKPAKPQAAKVLPAVTEVTPVSPLPKTSPKGFEVSPKMTVDKSVNLSFINNSILQIPQRDEREIFESRFGDMYKSVPVNMTLPQPERFIGPTNWWNPPWSFQKAKKRSNLNIFNLEDVHGEGGACAKCGGDPNAEGMGGSPIKWGDKTVCRNCANKMIAEADKRGEIVRRSLDRLLSLRKSNRG